MLSTSLILLLLCAPPVEPASPAVSVSPNGQSLQDYFESRLAAADGSMPRRHQRSVTPAGREFGLRVVPRSLAGRIQPPFPQALPGLKPLFSHPDPRMGVAAARLIRHWVDSEERSPDRLSPEARQSLGQLAHSWIAHPEWSEDNPELGAVAVRLFLMFSARNASPEELTTLVERLNPDKLTAARQVLGVFLAQERPRFHPVLAEPLRTLLESSRPEDSHFVIGLLKSMKACPPGVRSVLLETLARDPERGCAADLALLLARHGSVPAVAVPGLVRAFTRDVPAAGGMRGYGAFSYYVPDQPDRWTILQERQLAEQALWRAWPSRQTVSALMELLENNDYEIRRKGVRMLSRYGSAGLVALPKLQTMDTTRPPAGPNGLGWKSTWNRDFGPTLAFEAQYASARIRLACLLDLTCMDHHTRCLLSLACLIGRHLEQGVLSSGGPR